MVSWAANVAFKMMTYDEALATDSIAAQWISYSRNAALGSHTYILKDGPCVPAESGPHAEEGGDILSGMYAQGCATIEDSRICRQSGRRGGLDTVSGVGSKASALAMSTRN
jgi:hypothetical protein